MSAVARAQTNLAIVEQEEKIRLIEVDIHSLSSNYQQINSEYANMSRPDAIESRVTKAMTDVMVQKTREGSARNQPFNNWREWEAQNKPAYIAQENERVKALYSRVKETEARLNTAQSALRIERARLDVLKAQAQTK